MATSPFLWGAATSAHQVEGNNVHNDWYAWEKAHQAQGIVRSGRACDHYRLFAEDFALARTLGHSAHRLSLEWSRIEPVPGTFSQRALEHYRQVLTELRAQQLQSFVTLHHFTNPLWFARRGGWERQGSAHAFAQYVRTVVEQLGDLVDYWVTINEPMVYASQSYWRKRWPPQQQSLRAMLRVVRNLAAAHQQAYQRIHRVYPAARVGAAHHFIDYQPDREHWLDRTAAGLKRWFFNDRFVRMTGDTHDYLGINYYFSSRERATLFPPKAVAVPWTGPVTDLKWPINPTGLTRVLTSLKSYQLPIFVTENGLADADDRQRGDYIRSHIRAIEAAQAEGADVRGYLHWSLLDNFEWDLGFAPRFGLVAVDYATQQRTPRPSAYVYKAIIEQAQRSTTRSG